MPAYPRRSLLAAASLVAAAPRSARAGAEEGPALSRALDDLERAHGGRLGVAVLDTAAATPIDHRGNERFALCSTFKFLAAAFVLARVDRGQESLARRVVFARSDLVPYSPVTEQHAGAAGLTVGEICEAAVTLSDNTAGNLMLDGFGGPAALTDYLRSLGDTVTRLDRREPELNENRPGDPRDTTTPVAMLELMRTVVLGSVLSPASRECLVAWLVASRTGDRKLRAGVPVGWRVGDKTGAGANRATNDVAVLWPPARPPVLITAFYTASDAAPDTRDAVLAQVGRLATSG